MKTKLRKHKFFHEDTKLWKSKLIETKRLHLYQKLSTQKEFIHYKDIITDFDISYKNKSVLILGGGPTTKLFLDNNNDIFYDHVWSINRCDLYEKIPYLDLYYASRYILDIKNNWGDKNLQNFLKEKVNKLIIADHNQSDIFAIGRPERIKRLPNMIGDFTLRDIVGKDKSYRAIFRMASILGIGPKMIILAIYSGFKNIYVAGMDGYAPNGDNYHSFEEVKSSASSMKYYGPELHYEYMGDHYHAFYEYILELQKEYNFNFINLAENYPKISQFGQITKEWNKRI